ncbi:MAG: N-6 DNA methylase [archaeon]
MVELNIAKLVKSEDKYDITLFKKDRIDFIESNLLEKAGKPYIKCLIRDKEVVAKPEEIIQQLVLDKLINEYNYPSELIRVLHPVKFGREVKQADIIILNKNDKSSVYCVIEVKKHKEKDGLEQLRSYTNATGAPLAVWTNGTQITYFLRLKPNMLKPIRNIPKFNETIEDVEQRPFTYIDLMQNDKLAKERKSLKELIQLMEDEVLANAGVDVFEEIFKLIFIKLYDEMESSDDREEIERELSKGKKLDEIDGSNFRQLQFRSKGDVYRTKEVIENLFSDAKKQWQGIFDEGEPIRISDQNHLDICVSFLEEVKLFNSNLQVIDEAFEYLVNKSAKGEKGQYFTPRNVIDMCVHMLNPKESEFMIDTAAGSCGFTVHTIFEVWRKLMGQGKSHFSNFSNKKKTKEQEKYVGQVFGIDFDEKSVRVARTLNLIAGDGNTNVLHLNTLDYDRWDEKIKDDNWTQTYLSGFNRLKKLRQTNNSYKDYNFDIVMANPPFAGDIKDSRIIHKYALGENNGKFMTAISRDILFIERNLDFLKPGGRMAIVLPQGRYNNSSDERIRNYILEKCKLIAVVGLDVNTFKPHTGTKTSVLFVQKWNDNTTKGPICKKQDDYKVFFAVSEQSGKDNSGEPMYLKNEDGRNKLDENGHLIIKSDLMDIANQFEIWAKKEKLSFWS